MKKHLVIYINTNSAFKHDGAEFTKEAAQYEVYHMEAGDLVYSYPLSGKLSFTKRKIKTLDIISSVVAEHGDMDVFAFFGHGWRTITGKSGIQCGFQGPDDAKLLSVALVHAQVKTVILYSCLAAKDVLFHKDDNFCEWLGRAFNQQRHQCWKIFGHRTKGHTTMNPYVVCYQFRQTVNIMPGGTMHIKIIPSEAAIKKTEFKDIMTKESWQAWRKMLKEDYRFAYPFAGMEDNKTGELI